MGSYVELNDTLQITTEQGFPVQDLNLAKHRKKTITIDDVAGRVFEFHDKPGDRIYHNPPVRCFLAHNIDGKWLYWGKVLIIERTMRGESKETLVTSGKYKIIEIYDPVYQELFTRHESPAGLSFF